MKELGSVNDNHSVATRKLENMDDDCGVDHFE